MQKNYMLLGIIVVIHQILGFAWYSPILFGNLWAQNVGQNIEQLKAVTGVGPYIMSILCSLLLCMVLSKLIGMTNTKGIMGGIKLAVLLWIGIVFTTIAVHYSFLGISRFTLIDAFKDLIAMIIAGGILATTEE